MSFQAIKKLEEHIKCAICLEIYVDPKLLQCNHVYCEDCLTKLVSRDKQGKPTVTCPTCRQVMPITANGDFSPAFHINHLLEIYEAFRDIDAPTSMPAPTATPRFCPFHERKELELFCETCGELVCHNCVFQGQAHSAHEYNLISSSFESYKQNISSSLDPMEKNLASVKRALEHLDSTCAEVFEQRAAIEDGIHHSIRRLHEHLDVRKTELIGQLHRLIQEKLRDLSAQREELETTLAQLSSCLQFVKESLRISSQGEVLRMKRTVVEQVSELASSFTLGDLKPKCISRHELFCII